MAAHEVATEPLGGREIQVVLVGRIVQQPLILRVDAEDAEHRAVGHGDHELGGAVPLLAAVVGEDAGLGGARIERIVGRRGVHRIVVQPAGQVYRRDQPDPAHDRAASA